MKPKHRAGWPVGPWTWGVRIIVIAIFLAIVVSTTTASCGVQ